MLCLITEAHPVLSKSMASAAKYLMFGFSESNMSVIPRAERAIGYTRCWHPRFELVLSPLIVIVRVIVIGFLNPANLIPLPTPVARLP